MNTVKLQVRRICSAVRCFYVIILQTGIFSIHQSIPSHLSPINFMCLFA